MAQPRDRLPLVLEQPEGRSPSLVSDDLEVAPVHQRLYSPADCIARQVHLAGDLLVDRRVDARVVRVAREASQDQPCAGGISAAPRGAVDAREAHGTGLRPELPWTGAPVAVASCARRSMAQI